MIIGSIFAFTSVFIAAVSQILLKKAANKRYETFRKKFCNIIVVFAYFLMVLSSLFSVIALRYLQLNLMPVFQATSFFWVSLMAVLFLKERLSLKNIVGIVIISVGVLIYLL